MQDQDQRKYFSHATLTFVFTIASPNSRSSLIQLEVNKTQALYFCLSINRFGKPVSTLGASSAKTRFALLPEGMLFRIMLAPDKSMRRKSCRWSRCPLAAAQRACRPPTTRG